VPSRLSPVQSVLRERAFTSGLLPAVAHRLVRKGSIARADAVAVALATIVLATSARALEPHSVQEPHYGEALYHFYQGEHFEAMTRLQAAAATGRLRVHDEDGELLLGGMLLSWGQHQHAADVFTRLLDRSARVDIRDRAWFQLARVSYQRSAYTQAEQALARIGNTLDAEDSAEATLLKAQIHLRMDRPDAAVALLSNWRGPRDWTAFAHYNLGIALLRLERSEEAIRWLESAANAEPRNEEMRALGDRARLSLGYAKLAAGDTQGAQTSLGAVRLEGPYSNRALLGAGWAASEQGRYRDALTPWLVLSARDPLDSAVQESFLAVPYALAELHAHAQAADRYQHAIDLLQHEQTRLDAAITRVADGTLLQSLLAEDDISVPHVEWRLAALPDSDDSRYLHHLLAGNDFQTGLQNYRDLRFLADNLSEWAHSLAAFDEMLETQRLALAERAPRVHAAMETADADALDARRTALAEQAAQIERDRDVAALADREQATQWQELQDIAMRLQRMAGHADVEPLAQKHRVLLGVLYWSLDAAYEERLTRLRQSLDDTGRQTGEALIRAERVHEAQQLAPQRLDEFEARIAALAPRIAELQARVSRQLERQGEYLATLATDELLARRERLASYALQARFALAQILDRAAADDATLSELRQ
jgi:hypothetical protein